jgi:hypothetical protein
MRALSILTLFITGTLISCAHPAPVCQNQVPIGDGGYYCADGSGSTPSSESPISSENNTPLKSCNADDHNCVGPENMAGMYERVPVPNKPSPPKEVYGPDKQECEAGKASSCLKVSQLIQSQGVVDLYEAFYYYAKTCDLNKKLCSRHQKLFTWYDSKIPRQCKQMDLSAYFAPYPAAGELIKKEVLYHGVMDVIQKTPTGYLMTPDIPPPAGISPPVVFVKLAYDLNTKGFAGWFYLTGTTRYTGLDGFEHEVPMLRAYPGLIACSNETAIRCSKQGRGCL